MLISYPKLLTILQILQIFLFQIISLLLQHLKLFLKSLKILALHFVLFFLKYHCIFAKLILHFIIIFIMLPFKLTCTQYSRELKIYQNGLFYSNFQKPIYLCINHANQSIVLKVSEIQQQIDLGSLLQNTIQDCGHSQIVFKDNIIKCSKVQRNTRRQPLIQLLPKTINNEESMTPISFREHISNQTNKEQSLPITNNDFESKPLMDQNISHTTNNTFIDKSCVFIDCQSNKQNFLKQSQNINKFPQESNISYISKIQEQNYKNFESKASLDQLAQQRERIIQQLFSKLKIENRLSALNS